MTARASTVLDAYAVIAYLRGEPAAPAVNAPLAAGDAALTAAGVAEVLDHIERIGDVNDEDAALDLAQLGLLEGLAINSIIGANAGRLRSRRYHRTRCSVSMADCVAAEVARCDRILATSDPHLLDVCQAENIPTYVLSGSDGLTWKPSG